MCTVNEWQKKPKKKMDTADRLGKALGFFVGSYVIQLGT